jgi:hypothetical protein
MIYVIVRESGSYSDYGMEILFAYTDKATAENKLAELDGIQERAKAANKELLAFNIQLDKDYPIPYASRPNTAFNGKDPAWIKYAELAKEHGVKTVDLRKQEKERLAVKHNISIDDFHYGYDSSISIQEVEGH